MLSFLPASSPCAQALTTKGMAQLLEIDFANLRRLRRRYRLVGRQILFNHDIQFIPAAFQHVQNRGNIHFPHTQLAVAAPGLPSDKILQVRTDDLARAADGRSQALLRACATPRGDVAIHQRLSQPCVPRIAWKAVRMARILELQ